MDAELRAGAKGQSEEQLEATLDKALMLFRYIQVGVSPLCAAARQLLKASGFQGF